jgi:molybdopterin-guanine dinucleotide biosynthesis protein B
MPTLHQLIAELSPVDWVLIEGFKHADCLKVEVWRAVLGEPPLYPDDPFVTTVATDQPEALPVATARPVFQMNAVAALAAHLVDTGDRYDYLPPQ